MVVDLKDVVPFLAWLPGALLTWLLIVACLAAGATVTGWLVSALRHGPRAATLITGKVLRDAQLDWLYLSPRRVWALARLAIQESIRRRVVAVFAVFILILLFAGWFLDPGSVDPARLYLGSVLTITSYLVLLLALLLSSLSLPADIKNRTLHTVVTKPVRASEVMLGRIVGFTMVGTLLLVVMGVVNYVFVERGLTHTHQLTADNLHAVEGGVAGKKATLQGRTSRVHQHRHKVTIDANGKGRVEMEQRHTHELSVQKDGSYRLGPPEGMLLARVPVYGKLTFRDPSGQPVEKGINVGDEWTYRSFISGGTLAACVWTFEGITEDAFPAGLPVETNIEIFRTHKGEIEKGVPGSLSVRNPRTGKKVEVRIFEAKEFMIDTQFIPRELQVAGGKKADLFKDFVDDGKVEVWLQCVAPGQYFGAAQADLYLRARDASFAWNFVKGYVGIWLQMLLVIGLGVMFSTFLSGPVAMLATLGALLGGFFNDFMLRLATGQTFGGGPFESIIRILTQQNMTSQIEPGLRTTVAQTLDQAAEVVLRGMAAILPDFGRFSFAEYVASGFNISGDTVLTFTCRALAFVLPVLVAGYLCLKNREVGR
jgi:ABC-type transport system involved in multi-copper enzyme maturation permease subunit